MGLIHRADQRAPEIVALECHNCQARYSGDRIEDLGDPFVCTACGFGGMIPSSVVRAGDRLPPELADRWTMLPDALLDHAGVLGLGPHELVLIWALERHRRVLGEPVWPSRNRLEELTTLSEGQLKRANTKLQRLGLVTRGQAHYLKSGAFATNRYDVGPLLDVLAALERDQGVIVGHQRPAVSAEDGVEAPIEAPVGHERPADRGSPATPTVVHPRPTEVDAFEGDSFLTETPVGISSPADDDGLAPLIDLSGRSTSDTPRLTNGSGPEEHGASSCMDLADPLARRRCLRMKGIGALVAEFGVDYDAPLDELCVALTQRRAA